LNLSKNLEKIYKYELAAGNELLRIEEPGGTESPLAVILKRPLHFKEIERDLSLSPCVKRWEYRDYHFPFEAGYLCEETKHTIVGPVTDQ
jgi:hypothetical protein